MGPEVAWVLKARKGRKGNKQRNRVLPKEKGQRRGTSNRVEDKAVWRQRLAQLGRKEEEILHVLVCVDGAEPPTVRPTNRPVAT